MNTEELKYKVSSISPETIFLEEGEFLEAVISSEELMPLMNALRTDPELDFDYLFCLTCVDWKDHFMMVYHLLSKEHKHTLVVKAKISDTIHPEIETVCKIWRTAEFHEREVYDLFGVKFINHTDLRRLFLEEDWVGYPLRKDYTDENMIEI